MNDITIVIRYNGEKKTVPTQDDIFLRDLLEQLSDRGELPAGNAWVVTKMGSSSALDLSLTLAKNSVCDGDILDLALPTKGGADIRS